MASGIDQETRNLCVRINQNAEIMIVQRIERIVPVEGNIEGFDDDYNYNTGANKSRSI
ncbi:hypothetical protein FLA4_06680 [Candidatus Rickettsia kotlanii]|nr:hypothetical protein FLA4_06680 [Candidatus Rickettsia kotlanii]BDU61501.1 hypothetical protein HM2_06690 [Candidatus Rickettsia kotlanii]